MEIKKNRRSKEYLLREKELKKNRLKIKRNATTTDFPISYNFTSTSINK
jgi:hypothetical protein